MRGDLGHGYGKVFRKVQYGGLCSGGSQVWELREGAQYGRSRGRGTVGAYRYRGIEGSQYCLNCPLGFFGHGSSRTVTV